MSHHSRSPFGPRHGVPADAGAGRILLLLILFAVSAHGDSLTWQTGQGFRRAKVDPPRMGQVGFRKLDANQLGITFTNRLSHSRSILNRTLLNGSGVAGGDVDGDGWCDLFFCGLDSDNALYRNQGKWKFEDVTSTAGVACPNQDSTGAVFADVDGDGDVDLLVTALGHGVRLFQNDGKGHFHENTDQAGLRKNSGSTSLSLADVDGDGDLDMYVANYRTDTIADQPTTTFEVQMVQGEPVVTRVNGQPASSPRWTNRFEVGLAGNVMERGETDVLYLNDGTGKFSAVSFTDGTFLDEDGKPLTEPPGDWGLSVQMRDFTDDGAPDIYVCNDFSSPDRIWINDGRGRFRAIARTAIRTTSASSMGVDFADINRDGNVDCLVVDMLSPDHRMRNVQLGERTPFRWPAGMLDNRPQVDRNTLQLSRGDGTFAETAWYAGIEASDWSWSPVFLDVDLDGFEDILVINGVMRDFQNIDMAERIRRLKPGQQWLTQNEILQLVGQYPTLETPNIAFRNKHDGTFESVGAAWGFDLRGISQSMALADLDNDGDMDVVINNLRDAPALLRNEGNDPRLTIRLKGLAPNPAGIGARIKVRGGPVEQTQEMLCGGRYLAGDQSQRAFAAGSANAILEIEVIWRNGKRSLVPAAPNYIYEIDEAGAEPMGPPSEPEVSPLFEEVKSLPSAVHAELAFDDLLRQPLLTRMLSQGGPGVCWHDINQDGWDDLIVGSGRGGRLTVLENRGGTGFALSTNALLAREVMRDQTAILGMARSLLVGSSNYEDGTTNGGLIHIYDFQRNASGDSVLGSSFSTGPLSFADTDGDGDLDLFIGGRAMPGRYPEPADSLLLRNEGGRFVVAQRWEKLGLVNGSVFSDLDQDGFPELILATEWGPVRAFKLINGKYEERTREWGLSDYTGWWQGVATGDFDGDGRPEIVASNWGLNSRARTSREHPRKIYFGDFDRNGDFDLLEARFVPEIGKEAPDVTFNVVRAAIPFLQERIASFEAYGGLSIREILGDRFPLASVREVNTLESVHFSWRNGKFKGKPLPSMAQLAPAFGVCIDDLDGDGAEDLFLSQNFFAVAGYESRCDAGRGLLLKGNGLGELSPVSGQLSGIEVYGEQRGCALSDYDGDGRIDLAVAQNGNATKLYHNVGAAPGLRVRLKGPSGNPSAVGASLRLESTGKLGPLREVQAGNGYWSQNGAVQVLAGKSTDNTMNVWVRWPGGKETITPVPEGAREIEISRQGAARQVR